MRLSDQAIEELREIYRQEYGQDLSPDQAAEIGSRLLDLIRLLSRPLPERGQPPDPSRL